jgi:hypothetical protein
MISPEDFERLFPKAVRWVKEIENAILLVGDPLPTPARDDALTIGVSRVDDVRFTVRSEMPLPDDPELSQLAASRV